MLKNITYVRQRHNNKVGLLVQTIGPMAQVGNEIITGAKAACKDLGCSFDEKVVSRPSSPDLTALKSSIADLLFDFNVSVLIGGTNKTETQYLDTISQALDIPVFILSSAHDKYENKNFFKLSPTSLFMAQTILETVKAKNYKRLAILQPSGYSDNLTTSLLEISKSYGVTVSKHLKYNPENFESMKTATTQLLQISSSSRRNELLALVSEKKMEAEASGVEFNPENIRLPAKKDFDILVIPDNFKVVRHFLKLFKYHGLDSIEIAGNHLWRSPAIIDPWDPLLEGAVFADFVGNYKDLPDSLGVKIGGKGIFVNPSKMAAIDFRLLGYRSTSLGLNLTKLPDQRRNRFSKQLIDLFYKDKYFTNPLAFNKDRQTTWPTYMFSISKGKVSELKAPTR